MPDETRKVERMAVKIPVNIKVHPSMEKDFTLAQKEIIAVVIDVSASGIGVLSNIYIQEGLMVVIEMGEGVNKINFEGEVMSSRMAGRQYRVGISIKKIGERDKGKIVSLLRND
jgi:hypothetical protein